MGISNPTEGLRFTSWLYVHISITRLKLFLSMAEMMRHDKTQYRIGYGIVLQKNEYY